jgi:REP element-mobilizing transposase RayT
MCGMSRRPRVNLPGAPFHVMARVQNGEPLLAGLEHRIVRLIRKSAPYGGVQVLAYVVMPNHLHVVLLQGREPLGHYMHRLLHRVAIAVQSSRQREGHVFQRRFHAVACLNAEYFRNVVAYVHLNPVRAGLCASADEYPWSSHGAYCTSLVARDTGRIGGCELDADFALRLFASRRPRTSEWCRADYRSFLHWRQSSDPRPYDARIAALAEPAVAPLAGAPLRPFTDGGDAEWEECVAPRLPDTRPADCVPVARTVDLTRIALGTVAEFAPGMDLDLLRSGSKGRVVFRVRQVLIARALRAGYRPCQIARYLAVSSSSVSRVAVAVREGVL